MTCDRALQFQGESRTEFLGSVEIREGKKWLRADRVVHYEDRRIQVATGNVVLGDPTSELSAQEVTYLQDDNLAIAEREVLITNFENRVRLTCGRAEYNREQEYARATLSPVMVEFDSLQTETLRITANLIEFFDGGERVKATGDVEINRKNTRATCGVAEYFRQENRLELRDGPVAWQGKNRMQGNLIDLFFEERQLVRVHVVDSALMTSEVDSLEEGQRINSLSGGEITVSLVDEEIEKVIVEGTATSVYHLVEDGKLKGQNRVQGDRITLGWVDKELQRVMIQSEPGVSTGRYVSREHEMPSDHRENELRN